MDKHEVKGKMKDIGGRIERQAGEWTGDEKLQGEGAARQVEGKVQNAFGKVKDAARDMKDRMKHKEHADREDRDRNAA